MGAQTKFNAELAARIIEYTKSGAYIETAAAAAGISKQTLYTWLRKGTAPDASTEFREFAEQMHAAQAQDELRSVLQLEKLSGAGATRSAKCPRCDTLVTVAVPSQVQLHAVTWKLERKFPERYGGRLNVDTTVRVQTALEETLEECRPHMKPESYADFIRALARIQAVPSVD